MAGWSFDEGSPDNRSDTGLHLGATTSDWGASWLSRAMTTVLGDLDVHIGGVFVDGSDEFEEGEFEFRLETSPGVVVARLPIVVVNDDSAHLGLQGWTGTIRHDNEERDAVDVLQDWIDRFLRSPSWTPSSLVELERAVEALLTLLQISLFDNAKLRGALDEREPVLEQTQAVYTNLEIEITRRDRIDPGRVRRGTQTLAGLLMTATATFAGAAPVAVIDAIATAQPAGNTISVHQRIDNIYNLCDAAEKPPTRPAS